MAFENYPYSNFHELNLDWILGEVKRLISEYDKLNDTVNNYNSRFSELKSYIDNYFSTLDYRTEIYEVIEKLFSSGDVDQFIADYFNKRAMAKITNIENMSACIRERVPRKNPAQNYQTGTMYSPNNSYTPNDQKYWYMIESFADNSSPNLLCYNVNDNSLVNSVNMGDYKHGGVMAIKDGVLYTCNSEHTLQLWDISTPASPTLQNVRKIDILPYHILGWRKSTNSWLMADGGSNIYAVDSDFSNAVFMYSLTSHDAYTNLQDYHYDDNFGIIYKLTFYPSAIWLYDVATGNPITNMALPLTNSYITVGEPEGIFADGYNLYLLTSKICGCVGSQTMEMCGFYCNMIQPNGGRDNFKSVGGAVQIKVDALNGDILNKNTAYTSNNNYTFKFVEDAQNLQNAIGGEISFINNYPYSWHLYASCYYNFGNHTTGAVRLDSGANARFSNIAGFTGEPYNKAWIYLTGSNDLTINNLPDAVNNADVIIYATLCRLQITSAINIHHLYLQGCVLDSVGTLCNNIYAIGSVLNVRGCEIKNGDTQYFSATTKLTGTFLYNGNYRSDFIDKISEYNLPCFASAESLGTANYYFHPVKILLISTGGSAISSAEWYTTDGERHTVSCTITRSSGTAPFGNFTYYRYRFSLSSTPPPTGNLWLVKPE